MGHQRNRPEPEESNLGMKAGDFVVTARTQRQEAFQADHQLAVSISKSCSEDAANKPEGVLITWYGPWSYTVELCQKIPPGVVYECLAPETCEPL